MKRRRSEITAWTTCHATILTTLTIATRLMAAAVLGRSGACQPTASGGVRVLMLNGRSRSRWVIVAMQTVQRVVEMASKRLPAALCGAGVQADVRRQFVFRVLFQDCFLIIFTDSSCWNCR
jgi:hypothetical protein